jgi:hypothetical protein
MSIYKKLFEAKKEIGKISKDSKNPFFKSKYFDVNSLLEHVEPILQKHGLLLLQPISTDCVHTEIIDIEEPSTRIQSYIKLPPLTDPQKLGSAITYYRRYTLQSLLGLQAEDDDGNKASKPTPPKQKPLATSKVLEVASLGGFTIEDIKKKYTVTAEQEKNYK